MEYDDQNKTKQPNSSTGNSGLLSITSKLVGSGIDTSGASTSGISNAADASGTSGLVDNISGISDANQINKSNNSATAGGQQFSGNEVDEDGYSLQPPKEVAWDENKENGNKILLYER